MVEVIRTSRFIVWDDVLSPEDFGNLMVHVSKQQFFSVHKDGWAGVWKLTDGDCLRTDTTYGERFPTRSPLDKIYEAMVQACLSAPDLCGQNPHDWNRLSVTSYIYPNGSRLSWHGDSGTYTAALTYYCHPRWSPHWGGELLAAHTPHENLMPNIDYPVAPCVDHSRLDAWINAYGVGSLIMPKPNRLVLMQAGTCHMINRVDRAAGDNLRISVVGFTHVSPKAKGQHELVQAVEESILKLAA